MNESQAGTSQGQSKEPISQNVSQLSQVWSTAFLSWAEKNPTQYKNWYKEYIGTNRDIPIWDSPSDWIDDSNIVQGNRLDKILHETKTVRIGFVANTHNNNDHKPYGWYIDPQTEEIDGIEYHIGNAVVDEIAKYYDVELVAEWINLTATNLDGTANDNGRMADLLATDLNLDVDNIDVAMSGIIDKQISSGPVTLAYPSLMFYTGVLYTGAEYDGKDLTKEFQELQYDSEFEEKNPEWKLYDKLVKLFLRYPNLTVRAMAGPSDNASQFLYANANALNPDVNQDNFEQVSFGSEILDSIKNKDCHLIVADAMILGDCSQEYTDTVNLHLNPRFANMQTVPEDGSVENLSIDTDFMGPFLASEE